MGSSVSLLIYGKYGQVGSALASRAKNATIIASTDADFSVYENIEKVLEDINPSAIINATAYTNVDKAETDTEAAYKANVTIPESLAKYCKIMDIPFIHYSTDYVFPGEGNTPYKETDTPAPINIYGKTKLAGEQAIEAIGGKYIILRTSWVYNETHKNFLTTMLRFGKEREELSIVSDQIGAPTYAGDIADATLKALEKPFESGVYHLCNAGETSWYNYAQEIFELARTQNIPLIVDKVSPISSSEYKAAAKRPLNSRLNCDKAKMLLNITMPDWKERLSGLTFN
jgi:dTDP-4-dehydrorhamnose reductase